MGCQRRLDFFHPDWYTCEVIGMKPHRKNYEKEVKRAWREKVWSWWKSHTGLSQVSKDMEYWTLGDKIYDGIRECGELAHILEYGLLEVPESFISACFDKAKTAHNLPPCRHCGALGHNHSGDHQYQTSKGWKTLSYPIDSAIAIAYQGGGFRPQIINLDTTHFPKKAWRLANLVGQYCKPGSGTVMFINVIDDFMSRAASQDALLEGYRKCHHLQVSTPPEVVTSYQNGKCHLTTVALEWK